MHQLVAVGIREMTIFKFGLYTIGLYLENRAIEALQRKQDITVKDAISVIINREFEWSLRIVPLRNGSLAHLRDALVRRLRLADEEKTREKTISAFSSNFSNSPLEMNSEILFHWVPEEGLIIKKNKQLIGLHESSWTSQQLLHIYTDEKTSTVPGLVRELDDTLKHL